MNRTSLSLLLRLHCRPAHTQPSGRARTAERRDRPGERPMPRSATAAAATRAPKPVGAIAGPPTRFAFRARTRPTPSTAIPVRFPRLRAPSSSARTTRTSRAPISSPRRRRPITRPTAASASLATAARLSRAAPTSIASSTGPSAAIRTTRPGYLRRARVHSRHPQGGPVARHRRIAREPRAGAPVRPSTGTTTRARTWKGTSSGRSIPSSGRAMPSSLPTSPATRTSAPRTIRAERLRRRARRRQEHARRRAPRCKQILGPSLQANVVLVSRPLPGRRHRPRRALTMALPTLRPRAHDRRRHGLLPAVAVGAIERRVPLSRSVQLPARHHAGGPRDRHWYLYTATTSCSMAPDAASTSSRRTSKPR